MVRAAVSAIVVLAAIPAVAAIPPMISYQGFLADSTGDAVADGDYQISFAIYDVPAEGSPFWTSGEQTITLEKGLFTYFLGASRPLPDSLFADGATMYLGITVGSDSELSPRTALVSVPYAYKAIHADTAGYIPGASSNWAVADSVLSTIGYWGIARGDAGNSLHGDNAHTHVNLGSSSATGTAGQNYTNATVSGGSNNNATQIGATIGGGSNNTAGGVGSSVAGGGGNRAGGVSSTVAGGQVNHADGDYSMIPGGRSNDADSAYSFAAGRRAKARHDGVFVWADHTDAEFSSTGSGQFLIRAGGGVGIGTGSPSPGYQLDVNGYLKCVEVHETSDLRYKKEITPIENALETIHQLRGVNYRWKQDEFPDLAFDDRSHIGFIAQELAETIPEVVKPDTAGFMTVNYGRLTPLLVEAVNELKAENDDLRSELSEIKILLKRLVEED
jgi:hypothetical protein